MTAAAAAMVVGYGNSLRSDDGVGWHAAGRAAADPRLHGATVLRRHQLTPELALDVSRARIVVLIDAGHGPEPGVCTVERVERSAGPAPAWSHRLAPETLLGLAEDLYGHAPDTFVVRCGVQSLAVGDELSPAVAAALPAVVDAIAELVASDTHDGRPARPARPGPAPG